jgi:hypothetical protein
MNERNHADATPIESQPSVESEGLFGGVRQMAKEIFIKDIKNPAFPSRFVVLLKALVESDVGPKPARQK